MIPRRVGAAAARGGGPGPPAWVTYCAAYTGQFCVAFLRLLYSPLRISIFPVGVATSRVFLFSVLLLACGLWGNKRSTRGSLCPAPPRSPTGATGCHAPRALVSRPLSRHGFLSSALGFSGSPLLVPLRSAVAALGGKFTYLLTYLLRCGGALSPAPSRPSRTRAHRLGCTVHWAMAFHHLCTSRAHLDPPCFLTQFSIIVDASACCSLFAAFSQATGAARFSSPHAYGPCMRDTVLLGRDHVPCTASSLIRRGCRPASTTHSGLAGSRDHPPRRDTCH